ncbi:MAG: hypothetical protein MUP16_07640 [Sedimentisphaerales bacterium]|nr:hypothetical protein [Sedimentisphaerales bacterium]
MGEKEENPGRFRKKAKMKSRALRIILAASADTGYPNQGTQSWTILGFREIFRGGKRCGSTFEHSY